MANLKAVRKGSFRGVEFKVFTSDASFGRRLVDHEFAKRDIPYQEDMGRKAREFNVEAFVIGPNYLIQKNALISAVETEGPGLLIHPFYGNKQVSIKNFRVREAAGEQGMARIDFECVEAGTLTFPKSLIDPNSKLEGIVDGLRDASATDFLSKYNVLSKPQFVVDSARDKVEGVADFISTQTSSVSTLSNSVTDLAFSVRNLKADVNDLVHEPEALQSRLSSAMRLLSGAFGSKNDSVKVYSGFFGYGSDDIDPPFNTPNRTQQKKNSGAINDLVDREAICQAAIDAALIKHKSTEDADKVRRLLFDAIEAQKESCDDDDVYSNLLALKAGVAEAIPVSTETIPSIVQIELPQATPSLVLSYSLYENFEREQDILDRNNVSNPCFVPGGVALKVLTDG